METCYKIVDIIDGKIKTLFHGLNGSKVLPLGLWLEAEKKWVRDGTSKTWYWSGWHVTKSLQDCIDYLAKFENVEHKAVVACRARSIIPKAHSPSPIFLARRIAIDRVVYRHRSSA